MKVFANLVTMDQNVRIKTVALINHVNMVHALLI